MASEVALIGNDLDGDGVSDEVQLRNLFRTLDKNGNGFLTTDELACVAFCSGAHSTNARKDVDNPLQQFLAFCDADADGMISESEWDKRAYEFFRKQHQAGVSNFADCIKVISDEVMKAGQALLKSFRLGATDWNEVQSDGEEEGPFAQTAPKPDILIQLGQVLEVNIEGKWIACRVVEVREDNHFPHKLTFPGGTFKDQLCVIDVFHHRIFAPLWQEGQAPFRYLDDEEHHSIEDALASLLKQNSVDLRPQQLVSIIRQAREVAYHEPVLVAVEDGKEGVTLIGDIHGNFQSLRKFAEIVNFPEGGGTLMCLGDYVDRGPQSLETVVLLMCWKVLFPKRVFMLRGNHEDKNLNCRYGFLTECEKRFGDTAGEVAFRQINEFFAYLPLAAVVGKSIFCCHGGLGPTIRNLADIQSLSSMRPYRFSVPPSEDWQHVLLDLLWSDPIDAVVRRDTSDSTGFAPNKERKLGHVWNETATTAFLKMNDLKMIARGHECKANGFEYCHSGKVLTVFSSPGYSEDNLAAVFNFSGDISTMKCIVIDSDSQIVDKNARKDCAVCTCAVV